MILRKQLSKSSPLGEKRKAILILQKDFCEKNNPLSHYILRVKKLKLSYLDIKFQHATKT
jgi:hypothetical protein